MNIGFNTPFKYEEDVLKCIPEIYSKNLCWFSLAPKFSTLRVNTLKYKPDQIVEDIKMKLREDANKLSQTHSPVVYVHHVLNDCIIIGPWENLGVQKLPSSGDVIIDVTCGNAVLRGAHIFAPGVLSLSTNVKEGIHVDIYVDIKGECRRGLIQDFRGDKLFIGQGVSKVTRKALFANNAKVNGIAIEVYYRISKVPSLSFLPDCGLLQNLPSLICSHALNPTCEARVLDMCASPGNKTTHIATLMNNMGRVIALDKSETKISKIKSLSAIYGLTNIYPFVCDSTRAVLNSNEVCPNWEGPPFCKASFNKILLDSPCSALGHRPNLYNKITFKQLKSYAVELLKPGGTLVYSTCTVSMEENEGLIKWALEKYKHLKLSKAEPYLGSPGLIESGLSDVERGYVQRFDMVPGDSPESDTIGFFIAKFISEDYK